MEVEDVADPGVDGRDEVRGAVAIGDRDVADQRLIQHAVDGRGVVDAALGEAAGTPLGVLDEAAFGQTTLKLDRGDTLVLLTDGILEAQEEAGGRPGARVILPLLVRERALPPQAVARALCEDVLRRGGARIQDDMTVFVLRNPGTLA